MFTGRVLGPDGTLVGAVIEVTGTRLMAVTNADGDFTLTVPVRRAPLRLTASFAGYADETLTLPATERTATLELATPHLVKMARGQELNAYVKTAQRKTERTLRKL